MVLVILILFILVFKASLYSLENVLKMFKMLVELRIVIINVVGLIFKTNLKTTNVKMFCYL